MSDNKFNAAALMKKSLVPVRYRRKMYRPDLHTSEVPKVDHSQAQRAQKLVQPSERRGCFALLFGAFFATRPTQKKVVKPVPVATQKLSPVPQASAHRHNPTVPPVPVRTIHPDPQEQPTQAFSKVELALAAEFDTPKAEGRRGD